MSSAYSRTYASFAPFHTNALNVLLHLLTTPACLAAVFALSNAIIGTTLTAAVIIGYAVSLTAFLPFHLSVLSGISLALLFVESVFLPAQLTAVTGVNSNNSPTSLTELAIITALFFSAYFTQDLAHFIAGEQTYQSQYMKKDYSNAFSELAVHTYFLLPLVFDVSIQIKLHEQILEFYVLRSYVFYNNCASAVIANSSSVIREWLDGKSLPKDITSHWWFSELPAKVKQAFHQLVVNEEIINLFYKRYNKAMYIVEPLPDMNEIYVSTTSNNKINSDKVFYTKHVDGPFMFLPFVGVYRGVFVMNDNKLIRTVFPESPASHVLSTNDVCLFDFNREIHYIEQVEGAQQDQLRYSLKIHYAVYPRCLFYYGKLVAWLTTKYDQIARFLFLATLRPETLFDKLLSRFILLCTNVTFAIMHYCGGAAVLNFVAAMAIISNILPLIFPSFNFPLFMYSTSFVHYVIYICTYYCRGRDVAFERFKHVVMAYKALAVSHLAYYYITSFTFSNPLLSILSLSLIAFGVTLSTTAAVALGIDKTYFGFELGFVMPDSYRVSSFPYNTPIPHPMIVGNLIWLAGLQIMPAFREACPNVAYIHALLYTIHMLQEHFDIHKSNVESEAPPTTSTENSRKVK